MLKGRQIRMIYGSCALHFLFTFKKQFLIDFEICPGQDRTARQPDSRLPLPLKTLMARV